MFLKSDIFLKCFSRNKEYLKCHAKVTIKAADNNNIEGEKKMTNYEYLITKSDRCVSAARKAENEEIREVWLEKAEKLKAEAMNLSIEEAGKIR